VRDSGGRIIGSFELYLDVTRYRNEIWKFVVISGVMLCLILLWVFSISFLLLRKEAMQLKVFQKALEKQATTDFLTDTCNRRQLLAHCENEMSGLTRTREDDGQESSVGFIMLDIDHFKKINDTFGHAAGDEIIRELAARLRDSVRQHDIVGRYGGEEFLIVLPDAAEEQLRAIAERLWRSVRSEPFRYGGENIPVTISLGVAVSTVADEGHEEIIRRADDALYRSKNEGRDRISYAFPEGREAVHG
jgi:diguanylate cyclase (GGDEF)-like protein